MRGKDIRIKMAVNIARTPPNLFGIERRMAYAHKKYHSGIICTGVDRGLAGIKFSGSPNKVGKKKERNIKRKRYIIKPKISLDE